MAQLTIYLDDESLKRIEDAATKAKSSVSGWVKARLVQSLEDQWPADYFRMLGTLGDDFQRPAEIGFPGDAPRESF